jgi:hypothetical protein
LQSLLLTKAIRSLRIIFMQPNQVTSEHCEIWLDYNQEYCDKIEGFLTKYE